MCIRDSHSATMAKRIIERRQAHIQRHDSSATGLALLYPVETAVIALNDHRDIWPRNLSHHSQEGVVECPVDLDAAGAVQKLVRLADLFTGDLHVELHGARVEVDLNIRHLGAVVAEVASEVDYARFVRLNELRELVEIFLEPVDLAILDLVIGDEDERSGHGTSFRLSGLRDVKSSYRVYLHHVKSRVPTQGTGNPVSHSRSGLETDRRARHAGQAGRCCQQGGRVSPGCIPALWRSHWVAGGARGACGRDTWARRAGDACTGRTGGRGGT